MSFAHPVWLIAAGALVPILIVLWTLHDRRQRRALERFVAPHLAADLTGSLCPRRRRLQRLLHAGALVLLCAALAEPRAGERLVRIEQRGTDLLFAVDTSRSMLTPDVRPDRLTRAKLAILDLVPQLEGDGVGLIAFAGSAFVQCPVTLDYGAFEESVEALDTHVIPRGGTDLASAIREAREAFRAHDDRDRALVLLTDGEDLEGGALRAAQEASRDHVRIYTVGVGTSSGDLIPLPSEQGGGFLKDRAGRLVKSRLDERALEAIAQATGGRYVPLGAENQGLDTLYREVLAQRARHERESRTERVYVERFQWPLAASLALLLASLLVRARRPLARSAAPPAAAGPTARAASPAHSVARAALSRSAARTLVAPLPLASLGSGLALLALAPGAARAAGVDPERAYNDGTAAYRAGDYARAVEEFRASLGAQPSADATRLAHQEDAYYNLGNGLYRLGQKSEAQDPQHTLELWQKALAAYEGALQLRPDDADSRFNRDFVKRRLEALKQAHVSGASANSPSAGLQGSASAAGNSAPQDGSSNGTDSHSTESNSSSTGSNSSAQGSDSAQSGPPPSAAAGGDASASQKSAPSGAEQGPPSASSDAAPSAPPGVPAASASAPRQGRIASSLAPASGEPPPAGTRAESRPTGMSLDEARELLDSAKSEERRLPSARNGEAVSSSDEPLRDW